MAVTQKQIAERLNISRTTVAAALKGRSDVSERSRKRILAAAAEMGYDENSNQAARMLIAHRYGKSVTKGVVAVGYPRLRQATPHEIPYFVPILRGIEKEADKRGIDICLLPIKESDLPRLVREHAVDGLIELGHSSTVCAETRMAGLPVVTFQSREEGVCSIAPDDREGGRMVTKYLIERGHREIAYLGVNDPTMCVSEVRQQGYLDMMREHGLPVRDEWMVTSLNVPVSTAQAYCPGCSKCAACVGWSRLIENIGGILPGNFLPFTAIVCHNDAIAMGVIDRARDAGFAVPDDLSVTGFDDVSLDYDFQPPVTSVTFEREEVGREMLRVLEEAITQGNSAATTDQSVGTNRIFPMNLVVRSSAAEPRAARPKRDA